MERFVSGLLSLLDDVAAIVRIASSQVDDIAAQAAKAGAKTAGLAIDDAAVTPKYVTGLPAARELPIIWQIARASFFNKLVILLPAAMVLKAFFPWIIPPLLLIGGTYLCFEGAEKVWHLLFHSKQQGRTEIRPADPVHLERNRVRGAIKTDFILSAEIMTIALANINIGDWWMQAAVLAVVAIGMTILVYGAVALLVKADDIGLRMSTGGRLAFTRSLGRIIVRAMPSVLVVISTIGTAAMLWVGGSILVHSIQEMGWHAPYGIIGNIAKNVASTISVAPGFVAWLVTAVLDGILGLVVGVLLIVPVSSLQSLLKPLFPEKEETVADKPSGSIS